MKRGDIYWINLDPTAGSEIQKKRPCVLVGATPINEARRSVVVVNWDLKTTLDYSGKLPRQAGSCSL